VSSSVPLGDDDVSELRVGDPGEADDDDDAVRSSNAHSPSRSEDPESPCDGAAADTPEQNGGSWPSGGRGVHAPKE